MGCNRLQEPSGLELRRIGAAGRALAAAFFVGPLQTLFGFVPLSWPLLGALAAATVAYLDTAEAAKQFALRGS